MGLPHSGLAPEFLSRRLAGCRERLLALVATLPDDGWMGPYAQHLNAPLWELGHIAWFQEHWCLRVRPGVDPDDSPLLKPLGPSWHHWTDWLYNSSRIPHTARWQAPLLPREQVLEYAQTVLAQVQERLASGATFPDFFYYVELACYHEFMHIEAWWMMWQKRALAPPHVPELPALPVGGTLKIEAGPVTLGSRLEDGFLFDNEKWAHEVRLDAFEIDVRPVTCGEFAEFVDAGGYDSHALWSAAGLAWLAESKARHPCYWRREQGRWQMRRFHHWLELRPDEPVIHVNLYEAQAWAAWRGRRLPSAAEWVRAAAAPGFHLGRCWEWTGDAFAPYPEFSPDPYADYSRPWFGSQQEVRGAGCWVTDAVLARPTYRNFFEPYRPDPFIGFRTAR